MLYYTKREVRVLQFYNNAKTQLEYLKREEKNINTLQKNAPSGALITTNSSGRNYYYIKHKNNRRESLLHQPDKLSRYKKRDYFNQKIRKIKHNIKTLESFIQRYEPIDYTGSDSFENAASNQNQYKIENARHQYNDIFFRSKSEMNFAQLLTSYNIPFRYETALRLSDGKTIYPDFIVKRPSDGKIFIVEYFGMMSNEDYRNNAYEKINRYHRNGYTMWDNFIAIFEYDGVPVNLDSVDRIIKNFLL